MSRTLQDFLTPELFTFLLPELRDDIQDSLRLLDHFSRPRSAQDGLESPGDFAFIVFPLGRCYEGFLKLFFMHLGVLSEESYRSRFFRIGRSFNPDIKTHLRDELWIYDDVIEKTTPDVARRLWEMWLAGRNHLFHYFPDDRYEVSYAEAKALVEDLIEIMEDALRSSTSQSS